jgi:hypothetical protein
MGSATDVDPVCTGSMESDDALAAGVGEIEACVVANPIAATTPSAIGLAEWRPRLDELDDRVTAVAEQQEWHGDHKHDPDQAVTAAAIVALTMAVEPATSEDQHEYDDDDD